LQRRFKRRLVWIAGKEKDNEMRRKLAHKHPSHRRSTLYTAPTQTNTNHNHVTATNPL